MYSLEDFLIEHGPYEIYETRLHRGYVTKRPREDYEIEVFKAGGSRKGEFYILKNCPNSTTYCYRCYIRSMN